MKENQRGGTMIETLLVVGLIGILSIVGLDLINSLYTMFKQNMVSNELIEIQKNITARYRVMGFYDDLPNTQEEWEEEKLLPNQMLVGNKIHHRLGGEVIITPIIREGDDKANYFAIELFDVDRETCRNIGQISWRSSQSSDLFQLAIGNQTFTLPTRDNGIARGDDNALPVKAPLLLEACAENNHMTWIFR